MDTTGTYVCPYCGEAELLSKAQEAYRIRS